MPSGLVLLDKPAGITSHDLVAQLRKSMGTRKVGHAGTLDPMATGLMILGVNQGTKLMQFLSGLDKTYQATIKLGEGTTTDDAEGEVIFGGNASTISEAHLEAELAKLRGEISQVPSSVSAISIGGKRAYQLVREGQEVKLAARKVVIERLERTGDIQPIGETVSFPVEVDCSSGTYIRAIARDLGAALSVGGHLSSLRRTRIGPFNVTAASSNLVEARLISMAEAVSRLMPTVAVTAEQARDLGHGKRLTGSFSEPTAALFEGSLIAILESSGKILVGFPQEQNA